MISIISCCFNSSRRLPTTLDHIAKLNHYGNTVELIIVDNNSDDDTCKIAQQIWSKYTSTSIKLHIVLEPKQGLMNARKKGMEVSQGEYIVFCDDDNWLDINYLENARKILERETSVGACGGIIEGVLEITKPEWFDLISGSYAVGRQYETSGVVPISRGYLWGAGLVIRRKAWESLFSSGSTLKLSDRSGKKLSAGGDTEICLLMQLNGWKLWYDESLQLKHYIPSERLTLKYAFELYRGFGKASAILSGYFHKLRMHEIGYEHQFHLNWSAEARRLFRQINMQKKSLRNTPIAIGHFNYQSTVGRLFMVLALRKKYDQSFIYNQLNDKSSTK